MPTNKPRLSITITEQYKNTLDELVEMGIYLSREEAMRAGLRLLFKYHNLEIMQEEAKRKKR